MAGYRVPGALCVTRSEPIDTGTSCLQRTAPPGPLMTRIPQPPANSSQSSQYYFYSPAVKVVVEVPVAIAPGMTWDGFSRLLYDKTNEGLQRQANELLKRGAVTTVEARELVDARNQLLLRMRSRLTPFGELYSEILKPRASLKSFEELFKSKGSIEAVLKSVGKTRAVVDRIGAVSRVAGPASIVIEVTLTAVVIQQAAPQDRGRVAAREIGGVSGSVGGGLAGAWAGCASAALLASPTLAIPVAGEVTTGGACLFGGILGGMGLGWLGRKAGEQAGEGLYDIVNEVSEFRWNDAH